MTDSHKRFRVAFSFAGEKRDFVASLASLLAEKFGEATVLYDKYHEAEFAQWKLGLTLTELYREQSELIVVVICPDYSEKNWCGLEWLAIHGMLMSGRNREVMLCRFGQAKLQGTFENAGFVELDHKAADEAVKVILERLALNEGKLKDHYTKPPASSIATESDATDRKAPPADLRKSTPEGRKAASSPFHPVGAMGVEQTSYVMRACDSELKKAVENDRFVWLQGDFQFGKTSLLRRHTFWLDNNWIVICPDLELCGHSANEKFWRDFFAEIEETFTKERRVFIRPRFDWRALKLLVEQHRIAFLLDEIGTCKPHQVKRLIENFYSIAEKAPNNVKLIVSFMSTPMSFLAECGIGNPKYTTIWNIIHLESFTLDEVRQLVGLFPRDVAVLLYARIERIRSLTDCKPQKVQYLLHNLWETFRLSESACEPTASFLDKWFDGEGKR